MSVSIRDSDGDVARVAAMTTKISLAVTHLYAGQSNRGCVLLTPAQARRVAAALLKAADRIHPRR